MRRTRLVIAAVVVTLIASGCTSGASPEEIAALERAAALRDMEIAASEAAAALRDVADVGILADAVSVRASEASAFVPVDDGTSLDVGDAVQTDEDGRAQLTYGDGSLTRIDADSTFEIVSLAPQPLKAQLKLDAGRVWNRVQDLTETQGSFEIETPVATAAVRGTAFTVECVRDDGACTFSVAQGVVEVITISDIKVDVGAGESVTVLADGAVEALVALDDDEPTAGGGLAAADISGIWKGKFTVTSARPEAVSSLKGAAFVRRWQMKQACAAPCDATVTRIGNRKQELVKNRHPNPKVTMRGGTYSYVETELKRCVDRHTGEVLVPLYDATYDHKFHVTAATVDKDGKVRATAIAGSVSGILKLTADARAHPTCGGYPRRQHIKFTFLFRRAGG